MLETMITSIVNFIATSFSYLRRLLVYVFYDLLGIAPETMRLIALILILTTFASLILMTFIIYFKSLVLMVMEAKKSNNKKEKKPKNNKKVSNNEESDLGKTYSEDFLNFFGEEFDEIFEESKPKETKKERKKREREERLAKEEIKTAEENAKKALEEERRKASIESKEPLVNKASEKKSDKKDKEPILDDFSFDEEFLGITDTSETIATEAEGIIVEDNEINNIFDEDSEPTEEDALSSSIGGEFFELRKFLGLPQKLKSRTNHKYNLGIIVDMIGRGVTDLKISQALVTRSKGIVLQEQAIQIVEAVKEFISLCKQDVFKNTLRIKGPNEIDAIKDFISNDTSSAMILFMDLIEKETSRIDTAKNKSRKDAILRRLSNTVCTLGTIASTQEPSFATNCFEFAVEANPENPKAWSRVGDIYYETYRLDKAIFAYKKALEISDKEKDVQVIANANEMLAKSYYENENAFEAEKHKHIGIKYYSKLGVGTPLNEREWKVMNFIEYNAVENTEKTIAKILSDVA